MSKKIDRSFPLEVFVAHVNADAEDAFWIASITLLDAADNRVGREKRIAVYKLVKVLQPNEEITFTEVENDNG